MANGGGEAKIKVLLDVEDAKRGLRELNVEGAAAAGAIGGGGAGRGGGTRGGASGAASQGAAVGGAVAARQRPAGGGRAGMAGAASRGMGFGGLSRAPMAAVAGAALAMTPLPGVGAGVAAGALGPHTRESFAAGRAIAAPIGQGLADFWYGDRRGMASAATSAVEATQDAWAMAIGADGDLSGARAYFEKIRALRFREERGRARIASELAPEQMEAGIDQVFGEGTTKTWAVKMLEVQGRIARFLESLGF